ncbi:MAG: hypothetical protein K2O53_04905, partial [Bacteroidales bacterium]|nr:hypothetical protein [Bacteroidales bacterium]
MKPAFLSTYYPGDPLADGKAGADAPFFLMAGPCVIENEEMPFQIAEYIQKLCRERGIPFVFKASYRKANRSREDSFQGIGDEKALKVLSDVKRRYGVPVVTDIHTAEEAATAAAVADVLQNPGLICRQPELVRAAAGAGRCRS